MSTPPTPPTPILPHWLEVGLLELAWGVAEYPGPASNPRISAYLKVVGQNPDDEVSWCSAFVAWCMRPTDPPLLGITAAARSWLNWGTKLPTHRLGCVGVLWRVRPDSWQGHVGFVLDVSESSVYLLGGNQRDRVSVAAFPKDRILGYRWPS